MSVKSDGTVVYGLEVESVLDRLRENISMDHLSRLLVDIHQDSSTISENLLSSYQRALLDTLHAGQAKRRGKYNMVIAEKIDPSARRLPTSQTAVPQLVVAWGTR